MRNSLACMAIGIILSAAAAVCQTPAKAPAVVPIQTPAKAPAVVPILGDRALWGEDFYGLLAFLPDFQNAGEKRIAIFADRVVGARRYDSLEEAQRRARALNQDLRRGANRSLTTAVNRLFQVQQPQAVNATAIQFLDDRSYRVVVLAPNAQFLAPGLKTATVLERLGQPERVTTELLDDGTERRPVILTVYHYAGGAIAFAESDVAPRPGFINRIFLDVPAVTAALLKVER